MEIKQISSLEKIRTTADIPLKEINKKLLLQGSVFSYQLAFLSDFSFHAQVSVDSPLSKYITVYAVKDVPMDYPLDLNNSDDDYITDKPGLMPDLLIPLSEQDNNILCKQGCSVLWVELSLSDEFPAGEYPITLSFTYQKLSEPGEKFTIEKTLNIELIEERLPEQKMIFTQWFHVDCIASVHNVEIYSEEHWKLIEKYIAMAANLGINMLLTPVITPPLDTDLGIRRACTQLVRIEKNGNKYSFDFSLLNRWIKLCQAHNINRFEISHLFSQWDAKYSPNIEVSENGKKTFMFGWHVNANDISYKEFLQQFIPELIVFLDKAGIKKNCYFHISDEPELKHLESYKYAYSILKPLIGDCQIMDALSHFDFYKEGLIANPVCASDFIEPFLENNVEHLWTYYCCAQGKNVGNRFIAMPSYRNRILGLQLYKFGIEGFLHWGYNFYNCWRSRFAINPYVTTSADHSMQSGDPFSVYPGKNGPLPSLRALIFKEALQDICICRLLEKYIGKSCVIELIEKHANMNLTFSQYPRNSMFIPDLIEEMLRIIKERKLCL